MFLTRYVTESSEGFMIYTHTYLYWCKILAIENIWPQWIKVILELLGSKHKNKYESYWLDILPETDI
jgi:hypothetical protein